MVALLKNVDLMNVLHIMFSSDLIFLSKLRRIPILALHILIYQRTFSVNITFLCMLWLHYFTIFRHLIHLHW